MNVDRKLPEAEQVDLELAQQGNSSREKIAGTAGQRFCELKRPASSQQSSRANKFIYDASSEAEQLTNVKQVILNLYLGGLRQIWMVVFVISGSTRAGRVLLMLVFMVERLQREPSVSCLSPSSPLADVRIFFPHRLVSHDLQCNRTCQEEFDTPACDRFTVVAVVLAEPACPELMNFERIDLDSKVESTSLGLHASG